MNDIQMPENQEQTDNLLKIFLFITNGLLAGWEFSGGNVQRAALIVALVYLLEFVVVVCVLVNHRLHKAIQKSSIPASPEGF